jgi:hypothetical protein
MNITIKLPDNENVRNLDADSLVRCQEIFVALISSGGLTGVKGGKTVIHFDNEGLFQKIQLDYYPWQRRKL